MKRLFVSSSCLAAVLAFGVTTMAQSSAPPAQPPAQPPTAQPPAAPQEMKTAAQQVTLIGCVQKEADYRRAKDGTRGGVAGTGAGVGNEFVLINASVSTAPAPAGTSGTPGAAKAEAPAGTEAFELTGSAETQAEAFVGKRVEITGKLKAAETSATGTTGGRTEAVPGSRDLKLREVEVISVKETAGTCPAAR